MRAAFAHFREIFVIVIGASVSAAPAAFRIRRAVNRTEIQRAGGGRAGPFGGSGGAIEKGRWSLQENARGHFHTPVVDKLFPPGAVAAQSRNG